MHEDWVPDAATLYSNFVYENDALLWAQEKGLVWDGREPSAADGFSNHYYIGHDGEGNPIDNRSLIATDSQDNKEVPEDVWQLVEK